MYYRGEPCELTFSPCRIMYTVAFKLFAAGVVARVPLLIDRLVAPGSAIVASTTVAAATENRILGTP